MVFAPVVNLGLLLIFGSGICNENMRFPPSSLINLILSTSASAVPVEFTRTIPGVTYPILSGFTKSAKSAVSTFKVVLVLEYADVNEELL